MKLNLALIVASFTSAEALRGTRSRKLAASDVGVTVDAESNDWDLSETGPDFYSFLYRTGERNAVNPKNGRPNSNYLEAGRVYKKHDCSSNTLCFYVERIAPHYFDKNNMGADQTWIAEGDVNNKWREMTPEGFVWKYDANGNPIAWEGCFLIDPTYMGDVHGSFELHTQFIDAADGSSNTGSTGKLAKSGAIPLDLTCAPEPTPTCSNDASFPDADTGCSSPDASVCVKADTSMPASGAGGDRCKKCVNTMDGFGVDEGCGADTPVCQLADGDEPQSGLAGDQCVPAPTCMHTAFFPETDLGCGTDPEKLICVKENQHLPSVGNAGDACAYCVNTLDDNGIDEGCSAETPMCMNGDVEPTLLYAGTNCAPAPPCRNNELYPLADPGCSADAPICVDSTGHEPGPGLAGEQCTPCVNTNMGTSATDVDQGCSFDAPFCKADGVEPAEGVAGTGCVKCVNDMTGNGMDSGCSSDTPLCMLRDSEAPSGGVGDSCSVVPPEPVPDQPTPRFTCVNDKEGSEVDSGCTATHPLCKLGGQDVAIGQNGDGCHSEGGGYGDPHIKTWTGDVFDFHGECDMILAKSAGFGNGKGFEIQVRTEIRRDWSFIAEAAVRIGDDILEVGSHAAYHINKVAGEKLTKNTDLQEIGGYPVKYFNYGTRRHKFQIDLGDTGKIVIKVYNEFLAVSVDDAAQAEDFKDSVGLMGDYHTGKLVGRDGRVIEDTTEFGMEWQVRDTETSLFAEVKGVQYPQTCRMPSPKAIKRRRLMESSISYKEAEKACSKLGDEAKESCIFDILSTGDLGLAAADEI